MRLFISLLISLFLPAFASAQGTWTLGGLGIHGASYSGGPNDQFTLVPLIQYETGPWTFGGRNLVAYEISGEGPFNADLGLSFDMGQDSALAPQVDFAATGFASLSYRHPYFKISSTLTTRLFSNDPGSTMKFELASGYPVTDSLFIAGSVIATYADKSHHQSYYGLSANGLEKTELAVQAIYSPADTWTIIGGVTFGQLVDDISALSFVTDQRSTTFNLGISHKF